MTTLAPVSAVCASWSCCGILPRFAIAKTIFLSSALFVCSYIKSSPTLPSSGDVKVPISRNFNCQHCQMASLFFTIMGSQYRHGTPHGNNGLRAAQYANHDYTDDGDGAEAPPSYTATLGSVSLGVGPENSRLLDQVGQLRACGVDEYIDLPQIVVVGDQSTGKSSVLEALTNIPFPRSSVKCTKFATQIRLRRADEVQTIVKIIPDRMCSSAE